MRVSTNEADVDETEGVVEEVVEEHGHDGIENGTSGIKHGLFLSVHEVRDGYSCYWMYSGGIFYLVIYSEFFLFFVRVGYIRFDGEVLVLVAL